MLLGEVVAQHMLDHDGNENLTAHVLAATARPTHYGQRWRLEKSSGNEPIDAAVALAMAVNAAHQTMGEPTINPDDYRIVELDE